MMCSGWYGPCDNAGIPRPCQTAYHYESTEAKYRRQPTRTNQIEVETTPAEAAAWEEAHNPYPNKAPVLCDACAAEYKAYWDEMWRDYYSSVL